MSFESNAAVSPDMFACGILVGMSAATKDRNPGAAAVVPVAGPAQTVLGLCVSKVRFNTGSVAGPVTLLENTPAGTDRSTVFTIPPLDAAAVDTAVILP